MHNHSINFPCCQEMDFKSVWGSYSMASGAESLWYHSGGAQIIWFETEIQGGNVGKFQGCSLFLRKIQYVLVNVYMI